MNKEEIAQIEKDIISDTYDWDEFENEPRDWRKTYPNHHVCGLRGEGQYFVPYLQIGSRDGVVGIYMSSESSEKFRTKEKLDSFIDALIQARDSAFPEDGVEC